MSTNMRRAGQLINGFLSIRRSNIEDMLIKSSEFAF